MILFRSLILLFGVCTLLTSESIGQIETNIDTWKEEVQIVNKNAFSIDGEKFDYNISITFDGDIKNKKFGSWLTSWDIEIISNYWFKDPADEIEEIWLKPKNGEAFMLKESTDTEYLGGPTNLVKGDDFLMLINIPFDFMQSINQHKYFEIRFYYTDGTEFTWKADDEAINELEQMFNEAIRIQNKYK